jgi:hypothetical protein
MLNNRWFLRKNHLLLIIVEDKLLNCLNCLCLSFLTVLTVLTVLMIINKKYLFDFVTILLLHCGDKSFI